MKKIIGYIADGRGLGVKYLALLALIFGLVLGIIVKVYGQNGIPYAQQVADQMLPIKVVDGQIVEPQDTYKVVHLRLSEDSAPYPVPLVLDTVSDKLNIETLDPGAYVTRRHIYVVKDNEVRTYNLEGSFELPQDDYTGFFASILNWTALAAALIAFGGLFVLYFILTLIYSVCAMPLASLASKKMDFDRRMRLSAVVLITAYVFSWGLRLAVGLNIGTFVFFIMVIALQGFLIHKLPVTEPVLPLPEEPAAPKDEKKENIQAAAEEKPKVKKAPAKKKHAAKTAKPKAPAKEKPAAAPKAKSTAKTKKDKQ